MTNRADNGVTIINLRSLEGESDKDDGKWTLKEFLEPEYEETQRWNIFYIFISSFAILIDPLLCYVLTTKEDHMCILLDWKLVRVYICLRIAIDVFYLLEIIVFVKDIWKTRKYGKGKKLGACWKTITDDEMSKEDRLKFVTKKLYSNDRLAILPRILAALPIPETLLLSSFVYWDPTRNILIATPIQYVLRIIRIFGSQRWLRIKKTRTGRWLRHLLYLLTFILGSHQYGALWYYLAVRRQMDCWKPHCEAVLGYKCKTIYDFFCDNGDQPKQLVINSTLLQEWCPTINEDKNIYDFGIYLYALQSKITSSSYNLPQRILQSFWWGLRNLSSFCSNLQTSMRSWEIFFSLVVSISGMALFLVFLSSRVQASQERLNREKAKEKKKFWIRDIDLWLSKNDLSKLNTMNKDSKDLKTLQKTNKKKKKILKTVIIENIHKLEENKDIDVKNIISILPIEYKRSIMYILCLASLKKVPLLANLNEKMLKVICEHLKPVIYTEDSYIVQEGKPLAMMLFITQGIAWTYTTSEIDGAETSIKWLKRGDSYGEELLNWAFKYPSYSHLPISTRTIMSQEKVEAFALRASDLKSIVSKFWWHFTRELHQAELEQWQNLAASSIQAAWRSRVARARRSTLWDKFTVE